VTRRLKGRRGGSETSLMPTFMALFVASLASWIVQGMLPDAGGPILATLVSGLFWIVAFYFVRRWFAELRPDV